MGSSKQSLEERYQKISKPSGKM